jgi:hypothetical protein
MQKIECYEYGPDLKRLENEIFAEKLKDIIKVFKVLQLENRKVLVTNGPSKLECLY